MKKLLLTLAVLCGTVSGWAQGAIDFSNLSAAKMYRIYNQKEGESPKAWVVNSNSRGALADYNSNSDDQLWCLSPGEGDNEGKYLLYNASTGKYLRGVQGNYGVEATSNNNELRQGFMAGVSPTGIPILRRMAASSPCLCIHKTNLFYGLP